MRKKKRKKKRTTKDNFTRPSNPNKYDSPHTFNRFTSQCIDKIDTGRAKGIRKTHSLINKYLSQKNSRSTHNITLRVNKPTVNAYLSNAPHVRYINSLEEHLDGDYFLYYHNKPDSFIHLIDWDFDSIDNPDDNLMDDIYSTICFQRLCFNNSYFDLGSSSKSLNQFILIDSEPLHDLHMFSDSNLSFPRYICHVLSHISRLLRFAYNYPSPVQLPHNLKFDGFKGTIAHYDYMNFNGKVYYNKIINSGVFAKLPRPTSPEQFHTFYNMPIVDIITLIHFSIYLFNISVLSSPVDNTTFHKTLKSYNFLAELTEEPTLMAQDVFSLGKKAPGSNHASISFSSITLCTLPGNPHFQSKNQQWEDEDNSDALVRSRNILARYFTEYWKENKRKPTRQECRTYYRNHPSSTGAEDSGDICRLDAVYDYVDRWFKPEKVGTGAINSNKVMENIDNDEKILPTIITQQRIDCIKASHGSSYAKIRVEHKDLAIGMAYFFHTSMKAKEKNKDDSRELTVNTRKGMLKFIQELRQKGMLKRNEVWKDEKKCKAIRDVLEHIGWLECIDADWDEGVSKRWAIGRSYHRYNEFVEYVGQSTIDRIRTKGLVSVQDWDSMGNTA